MNNHSRSMEPTIHTFTRRDLNYIRFIVESYLERYFGEVWNLPETAKYKGVNWDCTSLLQLDQGLWHLIQAAKHRGALRAMAVLETLKSNSVVRITLLYDKDENGLDS